MSAFMCVPGSSSLALVTDGAAYNNEGVVVRIGRKVTTGRKAPIAVTTRGNHVAGHLHQKRICDLADEHGVDRAIELFEMALPELTTDPKNEGLDFLHWHIAAWSESRGPAQFSAHNMPFAFADGQEAFELTSPKKVYVAGNAITLDGVMAAGVTFMRPGEDPSDYMEREGANIMEAMRRLPAAPLSSEDRRIGQYLIGGQCDLTTVTERGARTKTLRRWPDRVGEKIDPFPEANVVPINRQQRRSMARDQQKRGRSAA